jgi:DNA adenine methylase
MINEITSPVIRGFGGKHNLAPWISSYFPENHIGYVEPYCGGAAVLFRKRPSDVEVINDLNGEILNFFDVLRDRADELVRAIDLTPYSRAEHKRAMVLVDDPLERARRFYIRSQQSFSSGEAQRTPSWRFQINGHSLVNRWNKTSHLWVAAHRLKNVQLECDTAEAIINRFDTPSTLFYVDPPYVHSTRTSTNDYAFEMTDDEHTALAKQLNAVEGMVVLSGYDCELYRDLYAGWKFVSIETDTVQKTKRTECLWINPRAQAKQMQRPLL